MVSSNTNRERFRSLLEAFLKSPHAIQRQVYLWTSSDSPKEYINQVINQFAPPPTIRIHEVDLLAIIDEADGMGTLPGKNIRQLIENSINPSSPNDKEYAPQINILTNVDIAVYFKVKVFIDCLQNDCQGTMTVINAPRHKNNDKLVKATNYDPNATKAHLIESIPKLPHLINKIIVD